MTSLLPELEVLPAGLLLDGELVAWGEDGRPSFPLLGEGILFRASGIAVTYLIFDVLALDGDSTMRLPHRKRRQLLDELNLSGPAWHTPPAWDDGEALWNVVCDRGLEGVVVKKRSAPYRPGERLWTKVKNRDYWRYPLELEAVQRKWRSAEFATT
jgi:bifunctional non-homologous end joining protein LigD